MPYDNIYPNTISLRLTGVARSRSSVPEVRSFNKAIPEIKKTKKKTINPISIGIIFAKKPVFLFP